MKFTITYLDSATDSLRVVHSADVPAKIAKLIEANITLIEMVEEAPTTVIQTTELSAEDAMKINMYDCLIATGVDNWQGYDEASKLYAELTGEFEDEGATESEAA